MNVHWTQPSHPGVIEVITQPGNFESYAISSSDFPPNALLARLTPPTLTSSSKAYSSVQVGPHPADSVELNCDFLFINHSCDPNLEFHIVHDPPSGSVAIEIRAAKRVDSSGTEYGLKKGETLTFFYPSTEWDMAQPFECRCGTARCLGVVHGARYLRRAELEAWFVNEHVWKLKEGQEAYEQGDGIVEGEEGGSASASRG